MIIKRTQNIASSRGTISGLGIWSDTESNASDVQMRASVMEQARYNFKETQISYPKLRLHHGNSMHVLDLPINDSDLMAIWPLTQ